MKGCITMAKQMEAMNFHFQNIKKKKKVKAAKFSYKNEGKKIPTGY